MTGCLLAQVTSSISSSGGSGAGKNCDSCCCCSCWLWWLLLLLLLLLLLTVLPAAETAAAVAVRTCWSTVPPCPHDWCPAATTVTVRSPWNRGTRTGGATLVVVPGTVWQGKTMNGSALAIVPVSSCGFEEADATLNVSS